MRNWGNLESYFILTFLATNFNLVAKKKKSFWIVAREQNSSKKTNFQPCSRTTTFIFIVLAFPNLSVGPFFGCLLPNFFPLLFPRFSTFWPSQKSKEFRERRKKEFEITGVESEFVRILQRVSATTALHCKIHCF